MKILIVMLAISVLLPAAAFANTGGSWMGQVVYINNRHIGVKAHSQTRDFLLDSNTEFLENGKKISSDRIKNGATVTVSYSASTLFGSTKALKVEMNTFTLPFPAST